MAEHRIAEVVGALWLLACVGAAVIAGKLLGDPPTWSVQGMTMLLATLALMTQYSRVRRIAARLIEADRG